MSPRIPKKSVLQAAVAITIAVVALPLLVFAASNHSSHFSTTTFTPAQIANFKKTFSFENSANNSKNGSKTAFAPISGIVKSVTLSGIYVTQSRFTEPQRSHTATTTRQKNVSARVVTNNVFVPITSATKIQNLMFGTSTPKTGIVVGERVMALEKSLNGATTTEMVMVLSPAAEKKTEKKITRKTITPGNKAKTTH